MLTKIPRKTEKTEYEHSKSHSIQLLIYNYFFLTFIISLSILQVIAKLLQILSCYVYPLLLFQLGGIGLLAYGSYIKNNNRLPILGILTIILDYVHLSFPWLLIMAAIVCILVSFLGCCGAVKKFRGMLTMVGFNLVIKCNFAIAFGTLVGLFLNDHMKKECFILQHFLLLLAMFIGVIVSGVLGYQYKQTVSTSALIITFSMFSSIDYNHSILQSSFLQCKFLLH